eukprot:s2912_g5.t1
MAAVAGDTGTSFSPFEVALQEAHGRLLAAHSAAMATMEALAMACHGAMAILAPPLCLAEEHQVSSMCVSACVFLQLKQSTNCMRLSRAV